MAINKADFDQLMNQARIKLIGASENGLKAELYDVLSEFFNDSSCWTQDVTIPYVSGTQNYSFSVAEGQIIRLSGVSDWGSTTPISPPPPNISVTPVAALMPNIGSLILKNAPNTNGFYQATVVTNVGLPTTREMIPIAPDWVLPIWHVGILDGVMGKMMCEPNKSYSNPTQGAYHLKRFRDAIARARVSKLRANTNGAQAWRFPQSFHTRGQGRAI